MPQFVRAHASVPGAEEAAAYGVPPVMYQPSNPYASAAYVTDGNGVSPLIGYPSQYPHVVHYTPRPRPDTLYQPNPSYADAMTLIRALGPVNYRPVQLSRVSAPRAAAPAAPATSQPNSSTTTPAQPATPQNPVQQPVQEQQTRTPNPDTGNSRQLSLQDVTAGGVPPMPPTAGTGVPPLIADPELAAQYSAAMEYARSTGRAPVPVVDPVLTNTSASVQNPELATQYADALNYAMNPQRSTEAATHPVTSEPSRTVAPVTSPVDTSAAFMAEMENVAAQAAAAEAMDTPVTPNELFTDIMVQDYVRALLAPYLQTLYQGRQLGRAAEEGIRRGPGVSPIAPPAGFMAPPAFVIP